MSAAQSIIFPIDARALAVRRITTTVRKIPSPPALQPSHRAPLPPPSTTPQPANFAEPGSVPIFFQGSVPIFSSGKMGTDPLASHSLLPAPRSWLRAPRDPLAVHRDHARFIPLARRVAGARRTDMEPRRRIPGQKNSMKPAFRWRSRLRRYSTRRSKRPLRKWTWRNEHRKSAY